jgi:hypothetical protein
MVIVGLSDGAAVVGAGVITHPDSYSNSESSETGSASSVIVVPASASSVHVGTKPVTPNPEHEVVPSSGQQPLKQLGENGKYEVPGRGSVGDSKQVE